LQSKGDISRNVAKDRRLITGHIDTSRVRGGAEKPRLLDRYIAQLPAPPDLLTYEGFFVLRELGPGHLPPVLQNLIIGHDPLRVSAKNAPGEDEAKEPEEEQVKCMPSQHGFLLVPKAGSF